MDVVAEVIFTKEEKWDKRKTKGMARVENQNLVFIHIFFPSANSCLIQWGQPSLESLALSAVLKKSQKPPKKSVEKYNRRCSLYTFDSKKSVGFTLQNQKMLQSILGSFETTSVFLLQHQRQFD